MTEKVLGFKEKDGKRIKRDFVSAFPIEWQIVEEKLVPVVSVEKYKNDLTKLKCENIDKWLRKKANLVGLSEQIVMARACIAIIDGIKEKKPIVSVKWLEKWCKENAKRKHFIIYEDLLAAVRKEASHE